MNNKIKMICCALTCMMIGGITVVGANQAIQAIQNMEIRVSLNGQVQEFKDETTGETQYPITYNNRTYLPLRNIASLLGLNVGYDESTNTATLETKEKSFDSIFEDIVKYNELSGSIWSVRRLNLDGQEIYSCYTGEGSPHLEIYDMKGNLLYSGNGDFGESDIYINEDGKLYYYEYNLVNGEEPDESQYEKYYLRYENNIISSFKENLKTETMSEAITRFVKEYGKQNPDFMISELVWGYKDYISYKKDGYIINIYYNNGKIKVVVHANTYIDSKDKTRKIQSSTNQVSYDEFIYRIAKVGNKDISKDEIDEIYSDLEQGKYGHESLSNVKKLENITFNYYNYGQFFSTSIEFDF